SRTARRRSAPAGWPLSSRTPAPAQDLREHDGVVVLRVARSVDKRQRPRTRAPPQLAKLVALASELVRVSAAELRETSRVVIEPAAKLAARRELSRPLAELRLLTRDPSRPDPVDQDPIAVGGLGRLICTFESNVHGYSLS